MSNDIINLSQVAEERLGPEVINEIANLEWDVDQDNESLDSLNTNSQIDKNVEVSIALEGLNAVFKGSNSTPLIIAITLGVLSLICSAITVVATILM